jgi:hypothetical protein
MAIPFATKAPTYSDVVKKVLWPETGVCHKVVIVNDTAADLVPGDVLGKVTATGKYKVAVETATDGSKVADAIVVEATTVAGSTDTKVLALIRGHAIVSKAGLRLGATYDTDAKKQAVYDALEAKLVFVNDAV